MNTQYVRLTGPLFQAKDMDAQVSIMVEGILLRAGAEIVALMRDETTPYDHDGTLTKSLAWRTAKRSSRIENSSHLISAPDRVDAVDIGSGAPHAWYREYGAGVHRNADGSALFLAEMKRWVRDKIGINPDGSNAERSIFWAIVNSIRNGPAAMSHVQNKQPFLAPVEPQIPALSVEIARDAVIAMWAKLGRMYPV